MSDFFDVDVPEPEEEPELGPMHRVPDWHGAPQGMLPGVVPLELVLARTDAVAICVTGIAAYPTGFEFDLRTLGAPDGGQLDPFMFEPPHRHRRRDEEMLRFGIQFADGTKVTNLGSHDAFLYGSGEPGHPVLVERGGGGGGTEWRQGFWVWPLPEAGEMTFVCEWTAAGIPLTRRPVETAPIRQAAARAQVIFSWDHVPYWDEDDEDEDE